MTLREFLTDRISSRTTGVSIYYSDPNVKFETSKFFLDAQGLYLEYPLRQYWKSDRDIWGDVEVVPNPSSYFECFIPDINGRIKISIS